jgi:hypothetical protein
MASPRLRCWAIQGGKAWGRIMISRNLQLFVAALMFEGTITQAKLIIRHCGTGSKPGWQPKAMILAFTFRRCRGEDSNWRRHVRAGRP